MVGNFIIVFVNLKSRLIEFLEEKKLNDSIS